MDETLKNLVEQLDALKERASGLEGKASEAAENGNTEAIAGFKATLDDEIMPEIKRITDERAVLEAKAEVKAITAKLTTLDQVIEDMRKPGAEFNIGTGSKAISDDGLYADGEHSFYQDIRMANKGRQESIERLGGGEGKAMSEGVGAQGGYLVQKSVERVITETREEDNVLRALCTKFNVTTNEIELNQITLGTTAGWVAELATKPESTSMTLATVAASVFTAAGLATISNQLLADSNPAVDTLVTRDLAKRLVALEEIAFLAGSGTGQPLGLLNTPGVQTQDAGAAGSPSADGALLDAILDAIAKVQTEHGEPSAIIMHPRTWVRILKAKDIAGLYWLGGRREDAGPSTEKTLFGTPVVTSSRMPTTLGGGTESRVIVGDFSEALILDRQGITVDESPHVYFTSNQTVFRAEERVGFTAARQPKAFCVIGGTGLAAG